MAAINAIKSEVEALKGERKKGDHPDVQVV